VLWAIVTITFFLMHTVPGGPFDRDRELPPAVRANLERKYGLDKPLFEQYAIYLKNLTKGDLGESMKDHRQVTVIIRDGLKVTAQLGISAFIFAVIFGFTMGLIAALNHNRVGDYLGVFFATVGSAAPNFILATFLVIIFSVQLGWTDVIGWELFNPRKMILPMISLGMLPAAYIARITRASMLEVLNQDYIRTARSKGLSELAVVIRHTVRNALVPVITVLGPIFAVLVTGSFIIETTFAINGVGRYFVSSISARDYGVIMGTTIFFATVVVTANLIVDLAYAIIDPRIRYR
jgi:ABC-type dipeptide/oligopeptide/nickel transport system permease component